MYIYIYTLYDVFAITITNLIWSFWEQLMHKTPQTNRRKPERLNPFTSLSSSPLWIQYPIQNGTMEMAGQGPAAEASACRSAGPPSGARACWITRQILPDLISLGPPPLPPAPFREISRAALCLHFPIFFPIKFSIKFQHDFLLIFDENNWWIFMISSCVLGNLGVDLTRPPSCVQT